MATAHKDMRLALEAAALQGVPARLAELCFADMQEAVDRGWGDLDNTAFLLLQEERAGASVRTARPAAPGGARS